MPVHESLSAQYLNFQQRKELINVDFKKLTLAVTWRTVEDETAGSSTS